jgi:hypothetical protein
MGVALSEKVTTVQIIPWIKLNREIMEEVLLTSYIQTCQSLSLQGVSQIMKLSWKDEEN